MNVERFDRVLRIRVIVSAITYAVFTGVTLHASLTGWLTDNPNPSVVLLLIAFFTWPRRALPKNWEAESEEDKALRDARKDRERFFQKVRLYYLFGAFFLMALLPFLMGEPVFRMR